MLGGSAELWEFGAVKLTSAEGESFCRQAYAEAQSSTRTALRYTEYGGERLRESIQFFL
jgi:hypothetical protein